MRTRTAPPSGQASATRARWIATAAAIACVARPNTTKIASPWVSASRPSCAANAVRNRARWTASISGYRFPRCREGAAGYLRQGCAPLCQAATLLNPNRITTADCAAPHYGSIHTDVDLVMLGCRAQDSRIPRQIPLRESGHHATPARPGDVQTHRRPDGERVADPGILRKALLP